MPTTFNTFEPGVSGMGLWGLPVASYPGGAVLFVDSGSGKDARGRVKFPGSSASSTTGGVTQGPIGDPYFPLASIAYALTLCLNGRGDVIFVQPGHIELPTANLNINIQGVSIIGLPTGNSSLRPIIQPQATGVTVNITGDGCVISNIIFDGTFVDAVAAVVTLNCSGAYIYNCHWKMTTATIGAILGLKITGGAGLLMEYCSCNATTASSGTTPTSFIGTATASHEHFTSRFGSYRGIFSAAIIADSAGGPFTNIELGPGNYLDQLTSTNVSNVTFQATATTGAMFGNFMYNARTSLPTTFIGGTDSSKLLLANNYGYYAKTGGPYSALLTPTVGT